MAKKIHPEVLTPDDESAEGSTEEQSPASTPMTTFGDPGEGVERFTRYLRHDLTEDEVLSMRLQREEGDAEIEKHQLELAELATKTKACKAKIDAQQSVGAELSKDIRNGYQWLDVPCWETEGERPEGLEIGYSDAPAGTEGMITVRGDTREVIEWREFRDDERQGALFDGASDASECGDEATV